MYDIKDDGYVGLTIYGEILKFPNGFTMIHLPTGKWLNFEAGSDCHKQFYMCFTHFNYLTKMSLRLSGDICSQFEIYHKTQNKYYSIDDFYKECRYD